MYYFSYNFCLIVAILVLNINIERQPNLSKKNIVQSFFPPKNFAQSWATTKKWLLECLGVN